MAAGESVPDLSFESDASDSEDDDDDDSDWKEDGHSPCLFCSNVYSTLSEAMSHCCLDHAFDLEKLKARFNMDCYGYIKLVNYIHTHRPPAELLMQAEQPLWNSDDYLRPVKPEDPWLTFDFEDIEVPCAGPDSSSSGGFHVNAEDGRVTMSEQHFAELQRKINHLSSQVREKESEVKTLREMMEKMRQVTQQVMADDEPVQGFQAIKLEDDVGYFNTYSHFSIHHEMLSDRVRTSSYKDAILCNSSLWADKTVLDLGCGTGILSMFAASAGADKVIAIDASDIIFNAMDIVRENKLLERIVLLKGRIEETELPHPGGRVDVLVSEWMGYFLLFEGMLDSVIYARDHHLAPGGLLLPNRCSMSLVGVGDTARHAGLVGFWSDVYGYRMTCLQHEVVREAVIEIVPPGRVVTTPCLLTQLDLGSVTVADLEFSSDLRLEVTVDGKLTALVGYFDVFFDLPHAVSFSTGPHAPPTHWKQTVFLVEEPLPVKKGDILTGKLVCQRQRKDLRALSVSISILGRNLKFLLSNEQ